MLHYYTTFQITCTFYLSNQLTYLPQFTTFPIYQLILKGITSTPCLTGRSYLIIKIRVTVVTGLLTANLLNNGKFLWCACVFLMFLCFEAIMSHTIRQLLDLHIKFFPSQVGTSSYCKINISVFGLERVLLHLLYGLEVEQQYIKTKLANEYSVQ